MAKGQNSPSPGKHSWPGACSLLRPYSRGSILYLLSWCVHCQKWLLETNSGCRAFVSFTSGISGSQDVCPEEECVSLIKWFSTVQQFFEKIVKCLGPLDQLNKCCRLGENPAFSWKKWLLKIFKKWKLSFNSIVFLSPFSIISPLVFLSHCAPLCYAAVEEPCGAAQLILFSFCWCCTNLSSCTFVIVTIQKQNQSIKNHLSLMSLSEMVVSKFLRFSC